MSECSKVPYANRWLATSAMRAIARRHAARGLKAPTGAYLCSSCRCWHLTSKPTSQVPPRDKVRVRRRAAAHGAASS